MKTALKLCLVFVVSFIGSACGAAVGPTARIVETWAQQACRVVQALPLAAASTLPPGAEVRMTATSASGVTVVASEGPTPAPTVAEPATTASAMASASASAGAP